MSQLNMYVVNVTSILLKYLVWKNICVHFLCIYKSKICKHGLSNYLFE